MAVAGSGYNADFVNELPEEFMCIVCYHALKKPVQIADCGHRFCEICFQQLKIHAERKWGNIIQRELFLAEKNHLKTLNGNWLLWK